VEAQSFDGDLASLPQQQSLPTPHCYCLKQKTGTAMPEESTHPQSLVRSSLAHVHAVILSLEPGNSLIQGAWYGGDILSHMGYVNSEQEKNVLYVVCI
jgi:hypothetical protein